MLPYIIKVNPHQKIAFSHDRTFLDKHLKAFAF